MDIFSSIYFAALFLAIGYHLGWKRGHRSGLRIHVAPPIINIVQANSDAKDGDWWKDNDRPPTEL